MEAIDLIKVHPPVVHFAIALPVALLVIDLYYRFKKIQPDGLHALITYLSVLAVVGGTISGIIAHEPVEDILHHTPVFEIHEYLGLSLTPLFLALGVVRFLIHRKPVFRNVFTVLLVLLVILLFYQGNLGGKIVYEHLIKL
ncbi:MAG: DUF2231 domain-containing protein [Thermocrinis sp.]|jgi:uncharacterized membrane protein|uniref:DUF2231 domain-containing protein n=1 Tax=Thermocrinis sp. TaxID=2024383 RepID=UPI003C056822